MIPHDPEIGFSIFKGMATGPRVFVKHTEDCPECGEALYLSEKGVIHLDPPRRRVVCRNCDYKGFVPWKGEMKSIDITDNCTIHRKEIKNVLEKEGPDGLDDEVHPRES